MQGLLSFFSGNINFSKYKDRFKQILVLELSGIVFSDSSSTFAFPLFLLFLIFSLLFLYCLPSLLVVHASLWRPPLPNRLLCFLFLLSYFLCLSLLSLFSEFMCYFPFTDCNVALLEFLKKMRYSV